MSENVVKTSPSRLTTLCQVKRSLIKEPASLTNSQFGWKMCNVIIKK